MLNGTGKYDDLLTEARLSAKATSAALIILDGKKGAGFSVQAQYSVLMQLPEVLEKLAHDIREQTSKSNMDI